MEPTDLEDAKRIPILDVIEALDLEPLSRDGKTFCWQHEEYTPSVQVYENENRWRAYCCATGGDTIDLVKTYFGCSFGRAVRWILSTGLEPIEGDGVGRRKVKEAVDFLRRVQTEVDERPETCDGWIQARWPGVANGPSGDLFSPTTHFHLGWTLQHLWIPHWYTDMDGLHCNGVKTRFWLNTDKKALKGSTYPRLYRAPHARAEMAVLCEGESDTWCMAAQLTDKPDIEAVGLPSGAGHHPESIISELGLYKHIYLALDTQKDNGDEDKAGVEATEAILEALWLRGPSGVEILPVPGGRVAEATANQWRPFA